MNAIDAKEETKMFVTMQGDQIEVDTSEEACKKFGFVAGEMVKIVRSNVDKGEYAIVAGVAPRSSNKNKNKRSKSTAWMNRVPDDEKKGGKKKVRKARSPSKTLWLYPVENNRERKILWTNGRIEKVKHYNFD